MFTNLCWFQSSVVSNIIAQLIELSGKNGANNFRLFLQSLTHAIFANFENLFPSRTGDKHDEKIGRI